jgi:hypothetical protein
MVFQLPVLQQELAHAFVVASWLSSRAGSSA